MNHKYPLTSATNYSSSAPNSTASPRPNCTANTRSAVPSYSKPATSRYTGYTTGSASPPARHYSSYHTLDNRRPSSRTSARLAFRTQASRRTARRCRSRQSCTCRILGRGNGCDRQRLSCHWEILKCRRGGFRCCRGLSTNSRLGSHIDSLGRGGRERRFAGLCRGGGFR